MRALSQKEFPKHFFLSGEHLAKVHDILNSRLCSEPNSTLTYVLNRKDGVEIEYIDYNDVINEENSKRNLITSLDIIAKSPRSNCKLSFVRKRNASFSLTSDDRDLALLVSEELSEYIRNEVVKKSYFGSPRDMIVNCAFVVFMCFMGLAIALDRPMNKPIMPNLKSASDSEKLNYLVLMANRARDPLLGTQSPSPSPIFYYFLAATIFLFIFSAIYLLIYMGNLFYIGKEIIDVDRKFKLRSNILWGIVIAGIIGLSSSLLAGKIHF